MKIDVSKYQDKKELFKFLVENKAELISLSKAHVKYADSISIENISITNKDYNYDNEDDLSSGSIKRVIVGNTYNWMDSHDDVHMDGLFTKSVSENKQKIMHLHDHLYQLTAKVGKPLDIFEQKLNWTDLGINKSGVTTALLMKSDIRKLYNEFIFDQYLTKQINQHSVGMQYVKIFLAVNDPEYKEEYATWNNYISRVANSEKAFEKGYFWAVTEAKLIEISAVIAGSNELTPTFEPSISTPKEPLDTKKSGIEYFINNFKL